MERIGAKHLAGYMVQAGVVTWLTIDYGLAVLPFAILLSIVPWVLKRQDPAALPGIAAEQTSVQQLTTRLSQSTSRNAIAAAEVSFSVDQLAHRLTSQLTAITQVAQNAEHISQQVENTSRYADKADQAAEAALCSSQAGKQALDQAVEVMHRLAIQADESLVMLGQLNDRASRIVKVTQVIENIARQTNLLALNAAIEAARAGTMGRGFAVVADEVRGLAARTALSTSEVSDIINEMNKEAQRVTGSIKELVKQVQCSVALIDQASGRLLEINIQGTQVKQETSQISDSITANRDQLSSLSTAVEQVRADLSSSDQQTLFLTNEADNLVQIAEQVSEMLAEVALDPYHQQFFDAARTAAAAITAQFENDVAQGNISIQDLFDRNLEPIANTAPRQYNSRFDTYTDGFLPAIQEPLLKAHSSLIYAIATTPEGYVPTHNNAFCRKPKGELEHDTRYCRTKRLFNDRTGARCGSHEQTLLLQTYKRDTGEIMHDLSVPIFVQGRHWGGIRLGYKPRS